jgi:hypothetical protein
VRGSKPRRKRNRISLDGLPHVDELNQNPHTYEAADRFTLYRPDQIEKLTAPVRIDLTFDDPIAIRSQAVTAIEALQAIIRLTREHKIGSIRQRIECRKEAAALGRVLRLLHGNHKA